MQPIITTILALASAVVVSANNYTFYCGSSCTDGTAVNTGSDYSGASCTNLETAYPYCYLEADEAFYKAVVSEGSNCLETGEQVIWPGDCFEGPWESFQIAVNL
ncbi:hypothetical protein M406DRAFT_354551 [Cryphonectria parasitica EP155]|uniref:Uncharacterized protein n=1 Tax=Cryphonectria parasitica (strain ATCC 38755 / EP155) TaxID=660469 RepID=A0A9P5CTV7_CRYP1|nr:uncharacterized protein M406DRAFT_354551 [Cryphonectria parasitica EP155]KAF3770748.1 hypothetical protein M406DRAFT_354551 [Cryphonectria parasitica EP155]